MKEMEGELSGSLSGIHGYKTEVAFFLGIIYSMQAETLKVLAPVFLLGNSRLRIRVRSGLTRE